MCPALTDSLQIMVVLVFGFHVLIGNLVPPSLNLVGCFIQKMTLFTGVYMIETSSLK